MTKDTVIQGLDQKTIYHALLAYHQEGLAKQVLKAFKLPHNDSNFAISKWGEIVDHIENPEGEVRIAIVGKYTQLKDSYKSLIEALQHAGIKHQHKVKLLWVNAGNLREDNITEKLAGVHGILVPGGFGVRDTEGKILAIKHARINNIPYFGICLGMQLAMIEFARNVLGIKDASSTEFGHNCTDIIGLMSEWEQKGQIVKRSENMGGTMRLGAYPCHLKENSQAYNAYGKQDITERHRHRYEFNIKFRDQFESKGMTLSGMSPDGKLTEIAELQGHSWFIGVQFHPELKSRAFSPHPLFTSFIKYAILYKDIA